MQHILGLDVGTNSIGWYLLKNLNGNYEIIDRGVVVFPIGTIVDPVKGLEKTRHAQRRIFRLTTRNRFRKKLRKWKLGKLLKSIGFYPERIQDSDFHFKETYGIRGHYQSFELYELRAKALDQKVKPEEFGRLFFLLNSYRGFKSSSKSLSDEIDGKKSDDEGKVKVEIENLNGFMSKSSSRTYGEYFYKMHLKAQALYDKGQWHNPNEPIDDRAFDENDNLIRLNSYGIRREHGRYTSRKVYELEFDLIWNEQKKHYPSILTGSKQEYDELKRKLYDVNKEERIRLVNQFKQTLYWQLKYGTIYYQRPLKSAKRYISKCPYETNKRAAPISGKEFQSFRIWKQLADIRYTDKEKDLLNESLPHEWRKAIFNYLQFNPVVYLKSGKGKTGICELLDINEKSIVFNFDTPDNDKYIKGDTTSNSLFRALGSDVYEKLSINNKLEKLWHLLYMKKDDEWLKITLNDNTQWPELTNLVHNLVDINLEDGYAPYSTKVLRKILPYMEQGDDEYTALGKASYKDIDQSFDETKWKPYAKVQTIKNGELRNPVVEKSVNETILLVNALLEKYPEIDKSNWEVHIETTRELKKPKKEREKMRRENSAKDELRVEYARFLNEQRLNGKLKGIVKTEIYKNSPIINKFELWLEMGGDKNDPEFAEFTKLEKLDSEKRIKHKLWLECNRVCPYSGNVINLTKLFSPEVEIEHIIPLSRGLDNSFTNKTLTFHYINKDKGNKTSFEFMEHDKKTFEKRIKAGNYSKEKIENFLRASVPIDFTHAQITNTSFIAKFVRKKMQEVCKPHFVYFTNGKVTSELRNNDWRIGSLLDKVRYEDATGNDIDESLQRFNVLKKDFHKFYRTKMSEDVKLPRSSKDFLEVPDDVIKEYDLTTNNNIKFTLDEINQFESFRDSKGKKDRSDHRHHALDAAIIAFCTPIVTKKLSTFNAIREENGISLFNENGRLTREEIPLPIDYHKLKASLKDIIVVNKTNQRLVVAKKNKISTKNGTIISSSTSIRASLHKDTYYGKLREPAKQRIDKSEAYVTRFNGYVWQFTSPDKLDDIYDTHLREIIRRRILWFNERQIPINEEAYKKYPLYRYSPVDYPISEPENPVSKKTGKPLPVVKKIRTLYKNYRSIIQLPKNKYADNDGNYLMALYELRELKKGKVKITRDFKLLSSYEAVHSKNEHLRMFPDEIEKDGKHLPLMKDCPFIMIGDLVIMYEDDNDKATINWGDKSDLKTRLYYVSQLGSSVKKVRDKEYEFGNVRFVKHNISKSRAIYKGSSYRAEYNLSYIEN